MEEENWKVGYWEQGHWISRRMARSSVRWTMQPKLLPLLTTTAFVFNNITVTNLVHLIVSCVFSCLSIVQIKRFY